MKLFYYKFEYLEPDILQFATEQYVGLYKTTLLKNARIRATLYRLCDTQIPTPPHGSIRRSGYRRKKNAGHTSREFYVMTSFVTSAHHDPHSPSMHKLPHRARYAKTMTRPRI